MGEDILCRSERSRHLNYLDDPEGYFSNVYQFCDNHFTQIESLNVRNVEYYLSVYVPPSFENDAGILIVAGGLTANNTMEYLIMDDTFKSNHWRICVDHLPASLYGHQINILQNKLILTGGWGSGGYKVATKNAWEGTISFEPELRIRWIALPPMLKSRTDHVAVVIGDKLFCIGGSTTKSTEYYSCITNAWQKGPDLPCKIHGAKGVVNPLSYQCFIVGGAVGDDPNTSKGVTFQNVYLFDPQKGLVDIHWTVDIPHFRYHIAVLL